MYIISLSCIIYTYCKLILKSPSRRINKKVLYCKFKETVWRTRVWLTLWLLYLSVYCTFCFTTNFWGDKFWEQRGAQWYEHLPPINVAAGSNLGVDAGRVC